MHRAGDDLVRLSDRPLGVHSEHRLAASVGQPDLPKAPLGRAAHARSDQLEAAVAGGFGKLVDARVAHNLSIT